MPVIYFLFTQVFCGQTLFNGLRIYLSLANGLRIYLLFANGLRIYLSADKWYLTLIDSGMFVRCRFVVPTVPGSPGYAITLLSSANNWKSTEGSLES